MSNEMIEVNRELCRTCIYKGALNGDNWQIACDYYLITKQRRNCPTGYCDKRIEGKPKRRKGLKIK